MGEQKTAAMGEQKTATSLNEGGAWPIQAALVRSKLSLLFLEMTQNFKKQHIKGTEIIQYFNFILLLKVEGLQSSIFAVE